jgi:hypothetical protein
MMRLEGRAPAKLNLTLEVLGRRADGYHEVASVMHTLSLCDTLTLELPPPESFDPARGAIHIIEPSDSPPLREAIPTDSRNLVWQAVARFVALTPSPSPAAWERGDARQHFWSAEASASAACGSSASALHIPLSRVGERGTQGVRAIPRGAPSSPSASRRKRGWAEAAATPHAPCACLTSGRRGTSAPSRTMRFTPSPAS